MRLSFPLHGIESAQRAAERQGLTASADAALVLGARVRPDRPSLELKARLDYACELWRAHCVSAILVSGGDVGRDDEIAVMTRYLIQQGIPGPVILACTPGNNTWQSLASVQRLQKRYGMKQLIIVSSGYHAARINWIARHLHLSAKVCAPSSTPETRHPATLRKQQWREFIALIWTRIAVAIHARSVHADDPPQAETRAAGVQATGPAANQPTQG